MPDDREKALRKELKLNQLYLAIISRYKEYIEQMEHLSVAELPTLVTPKNQVVMTKTDDIKRYFGQYNFKSHFYEASISAFYYVKNEIDDVVMPVRFWLKPEDTITFGVGDLLDRHTLLCSMLIALGNPSSKVLVHINGPNRRVITYYELEGKAYILDFALGFKKFESREELIKSLGMTDETITYEFNDNMHIELG